MPPCTIADNNLYTKAIRSPSEERGADGFCSCKQIRLIKDDSNTHFQKRPVLLDDPNLGGVFGDTTAAAAGGGDAGFELELSSLEGGTCL